MDHCCRKDNRIPEFSGVISTARAPPTPGGNRPWSLPPHRNSPQSRADSPPRTNRPYGHPNPYPSAPTRAASARHKSPPSPCPNTPHNHLGGTESSPSPACRPTFHHRQLPRLGQFPGPWPVPTSVQPAQLYSCAIQQRRRPTPAPNDCHWPVSCGNNHD